MHFLIVGETGTGKTTWARLQAAKVAKEKKRGVLVLDPFLDEWPETAFVTRERETFLAEFWKRDECLCIVDESSITAPRNEDSMHETATLGRHQGHLLLFLCQRVAQVHPNIRGQCSHLVCFGCSAKDARLLAEEYDNDGLLEAATLPAGTFLYLHRRGTLVKEKIF